MKNLLFPKPQRLLIQFKASKNLKERIESFRTTSAEKAQKIINRRRKDNIIFATFGESRYRIMTDKKLSLSKSEAY